MFYISWLDNTGMATAVWTDVINALISFPNGFVICRQKYSGRKFSQKERLICQSKVSTGTAQATRGEVFSQRVL